MPNHSQEPPSPINAKNQDLKDMDVICIFKTEIVSSVGVGDKFGAEQLFPNRSRKTAKALKLSFQIS